MDYRYYIGKALDAENDSAKIEQGTVPCSAK